MKKTTKTFLAGIGVGYILSKVLTGTPAVGKLKRGTFFIVEDDAEGLLVDKPMAIRSKSSTARRRRSFSSII